MILLSSSLNSFLQLLGVLIIFAFVLVITYFTTRWIGGVQKSQMAGKSLQVIETARLAGNKYLQMIKAGEVYLIVAVGKDEVTMLAKLTAEELGVSEEQLADAMHTMKSGKKENNLEGQETFQAVLDRFKTHFPKKQD